MSEPTPRTAKALDDLEARKNAPAWYNTMYGRMFIWCLLVLGYGYVSPTDFTHLISAAGGGVFWVWWLN